MAPAPTSRPRLAFAGTPDFAARILRALIKAGYPIDLVLTQPDRASGRGRRVRPSAVRALAETAGLPVQTPTRLRDPGLQEALRARQLDAMVVAAYGMLLPPAILALPRHGCLNVHASLLPRWRGAAPIERAIMAGDAETGVSIMQMDAGLDTGPVFLQRAVGIDSDTTGDSLHAALAELGASCLLEVLDRLGDMTPTPQPEQGVCHAPKLTAADAVIDWHRDAAVIARQVRALNARLPAFSFIAGERVRILLAHEVDMDVSSNASTSATSLSHSSTPSSSSTASVSLSCAGASVPVPGQILTAARNGLVLQCGTGRLQVTQVQLSRGKGRPMDAGPAINGYPKLFRPGMVFDGRS